MATIIDRRNDPKKDSAVNRKRFIERYKTKIKDSIDRAIRDTDIKDIDKNSVKGKGKEGGVLDEPSFSYDPRDGAKEIISSGNERYSKDEEIPRPINRGEGSGAGNGEGGEQEDDFSFTLTKEEFLDLYFNDMALPNFVKQNMKKQTKFVFRRAGYTREGTPSKLNLKKSFENALARRIANKKSKTKLPWLDDIDLRYNYFKKHPEPIRKAVMFCLMDVSGSMFEEEKMIAKKFYILLFLFLTKMYENVDVVFIRYHHEAKECDEDEFFYGKDTGGTVTSKAFDVMDDIIKERYNPDDTNLYVAHASDGDNWDSDNETLFHKLNDDIMDKIQYLAYVQVRDSGDDYGLLAFYTALKDHGFNKINPTRAYSPADVYPALRTLFKKGGIDE